MKCLEETIRQKKMPSEKTLNFKENLKTIERVNEHLNDVQIARAKLQAVREQNAKSPHLYVHIAVDQYFLNVFSYLSYSQVFRRPDLRIRCSEL
ncbi:hypothetical protein Cadr_000031389 [Camelus dromedarius]|uniref:Uncharacterized protein n=1 Tax=Camelus dromedarius TaxID=9838 RepID=A0A5N4BX63_CAMDR|nr:hypothetical protein Cadr_000031389 [Camelus dromedarius]